MASRSGLATRSWICSPFMRPLQHSCFGLRRFFAEKYIRTMYELGMSKWKCMLSVSRWGHFYWTLLEGSHVTQQKETYFGGVFNCNSRWKCVGKKRTDYVPFYYNGGMKDVIPGGSVLKKPFDISSFLLDGTQRVVLGN